MSEVYRLETADGAVVADHVEVADTLWTRFLGLMFRRELPAGPRAGDPPVQLHPHVLHALRARRACSSTRDGRVVRVLDSIRPWRASSLVRGAKAAIELPAGTAARSSLVPGMVLQLVEAGTPAAVELRRAGGRLRTMGR